MQITSGRLHLEWLPYAAISTLHILTAEGGRDSLASACGLTSTPQIALWDVVTWHRAKLGLVIFSFKGKLEGADQRRQAELLVATLLMNFPQLAIRAEHKLEVMFTSLPTDHPVIVTLRPVTPVEAILETDLTSPPTVSLIDNHRALTGFIYQERTFSFRMYTLTRRSVDWSVCGHADGVGHDIEGNTNNGLRIRRSAETK
ncbi:unnamed protein product [Phytophthora fragariaefolia]|uniref:Unnamed protein product n=1 Tax=Phytophthora fragariaefolia TaxID=1490495 RepID=A0A9W7CYM0_9STRA|nr:unnamed protein product [Phytophthora fragariaefolia]